jgi:hypothetical protein
MARIAFLLLAALIANAQGISPDGPQQAARFDTVLRAVARSGYTAPAVVALTPDPSGAVFVILASKGGKGTLLATVEPDGALVEIEAGETPAMMGVTGARFEPFLGAVGVIDIVVSHRPPGLVQPHTFERHHVLRRSGKMLAKACDFDGGSTTTVMKGARSLTSTKTVSLEKPPAASGPFTFIVKTTEEMSEHGSPDPPSKTRRQEPEKRYELPMTGMCIAR